MRRRGAGVLVITLTVLAAVVVPNVGTRSVRGVPQATTIPGPPAVGDCLLTPVSIATGLADTAGTGGASDHPTDLIVAPCTGPRFGEVVLLHDVGTLAAFVDGVQVTYPQDDSCYAASQSYVGLPEVTGDPSPLFTYWFPVGGGTTMELAPSALHRAAGRTWTACVVLATDDDGRSLAYPDSVRDGYASGSPPSAFGVCTDTADIAAFAMVPCDGPHHLEILGYSGDLQGATAPSIARTCTDLAVDQTRMADPTAGGVLQIRPALGHYDQGGILRPGLRDSPGGFADVALCRVIAPDDRPLTGTLLGLGERPVPWA